MEKQSCPPQWHPTRCLMMSHNEVIFQLHGATFERAGFYDFRLWANNMFLEAHFPRLGLYQFYDTPWRAEVGHRDWRKAGVNSPRALE